MDDFSRRKREEDLIFQNIEEKALLKRQAVAEEKWQQLYRKIEESVIQKESVFRMLADERPLPEVIDFLDHEILEKNV